MQWQEKARTVLRQNGVILSPTDTIWGLSGNALEDEVIQNIQKIKNRPQKKSFIVLLPSVESLRHYVSDNLEKVIPFLNNQKKTITVIYAKPKGFPSRLLAADGSIAIRLPKSVWLQTFLASLNFPLISTSANFSGASFSGHFDDIDERIKQKVDFIVPIHQQDKMTASSQIVRFTSSGEVEWIRK